eukprot:CAMPEP_0171062338 /NCGR_PEP_ID=MMETSP0766_2-20121228/5005_1 /TAXON_ID=439317 /ORGANISM="Gambierdiscus australes, Strain CAWD 149" /LENGTH=726 /DNA_ID=CAMNT_0011518135 /DNA_START=60 /DNA_END=2239 /DNA_ORIENTATION=+
MPTSGRSEEMAELLDLPLNDQSGGGKQQGVGNTTAMADGIDSEAVNARDQQLRELGMFVIDAIASVVFWYVMLWCINWPLPGMYLFGLLLVLMVAYRMYRAKTSSDECGVEIPYTCGYVPSNDKELFLVATIHISPRAPKDVEAVIDRTLPDIAMIELDDERLDRMRDVEVEPQEPRREDLQPIRISEDDGESCTVLAQRALWNAERSGEAISGEVVFDEENEFGLLRTGEHYMGKLALVRRGAPNGEFAPFALKAHNAAVCGAQAVLVINQRGHLPVNRIGGGTLVGDLRVALNTCSCGFPPIPVLLLPNEEGEHLAKICNTKCSSGTARAELKVLEDEYPRRTLRRRLCQTCALLFSGIGVLYGIIQCCDVEVGAEFLAAEVAASARGIPCTCIDVDLNRFWSRLGWALLPTPCHSLDSALAWLGFPRVFFQVLFPPKGNVDVMGSMVLHGISFPLRTWLAFLLAGLCASSITSRILKLFGTGVEKAGEATGTVDPDDAAVVQGWIVFWIEMYMMPRVYHAVAASRDEAMYNSIVEKSRHARRLVVVVGAGHANGILQRAAQEWPLSVQGHATLNSGAATSTASVSAPPVEGIGISLHVQSQKQPCAGKHNASAALAHCEVAAHSTTDPVFLVRTSARKLWVHLRCPFVWCTCASGEGCGLAELEGLCCAALLQVGCSHPHPRTACRQRTPPMPAQPQGGLASTAQSAQSAKCRTAHGTLPRRL